jgi:hypothetical protein
VRRVIYFEPRFDYTLRGVYYKGFYRKLANERSPELDCKNIEINYINPFGQYVQLAMQRDGDNPVLNEFYNENLTSVPYNGVQFDLNELSKRGSTLRNPYFSDLALHITPSVVASYLPFVYSGEINIDNTLNEAKHASQPKVGLVHRSATSILLDGGTRKNDAPLIAQRIGRIQYNALPIDTGFTLSYADNELIDSSPEQNSKRVPGLVSTFYMDYLSTIRQGRVLNGQFLLSNYYVASQNFRDLKTIELQQRFSRLILLSISNFKPLQNTLSEQTLIQYKNKTVQDDLLLTHYELGSVPTNSVGQFITYTSALLSATTNCISTQLTQVRLSNNFTLQLNYPYDLDNNTEAVRLQANLITIFENLNFSYQSITVSNDFEIEITESELSIKDVVIDCGGAELTFPFMRDPTPICSYLSPLKLSLGNSQAELTGIFGLAQTALPLPNYPYDIFDSGEVQQLEQDLIAYFQSISIAFSGIDAEFLPAVLAPPFPPSRFRISFIDIAYELSYYELDLGGGEIDKQFFQKQNCN